VLTLARDQLTLHLIYHISHNLNDCMAIMMHQVDNIERLVQLAYASEKSGWA